jgi:hypothetical protein
MLDETQVKSYENRRISPIPILPKQKQEASFLFAYTDVLSNLAVEET